MSKQLTAYDEVPYISHPYRQTHPSNLATIARLFGIREVPTEKIRVLELGCASGGNLIPMADEMPDGQFAGIDLSSRQIADGQKIIAEVGLKNVELRCQSIGDIDKSWGQYDYIICHGVYSWVPPDIKEKILQICSENLAASGVAYVSYNTFPGWRMRGTIRDMMVWHTQGIEDAQDRARHARALLDVLVKNVPQEGNAFGLMLQSESKLLSRHSDSYLLHEYLEENNDPVYFREFIAAAESNNLRYLGEAEFGAMIPPPGSEQAEAIFERLASDEVALEQYRDFYRNRAFRQTLLCHRNVEIDRRIQPAHVKDLFVSTDVHFEKVPESLNTEEEVSFANESGALRTRDPLLTAALAVLIEEPDAPLPFRDLTSRVHSKLGRSRVQDANRVQQDEEHIMSALLEAYGRRFVQLRAFPPSWISDPGDRPRVSALARYQARSATTVTNRRHQVVGLDDLSLRIVRLADGSRSRTEILAELMRQTQEGELTIRIDDSTGNSPDAAETALQEQTDLTLKQLATQALIC